MNLSVIAAIVGGAAASRIAAEASRIAETEGESTRRRKAENLCGAANGFVVRSARVLGCTPRDIHSAAAAI